MEKEIVIVSIKQGKLKGKIAKGIVDANYYSFQGIPYAKPPLGDLRFKAPQPADAWNGIRDATKEASICISYDLVDKTTSGSEDCLFLNVYTPALPSENANLKPVMVWIHGGGFTHGSGNTDFFGPDFLIPHDVVIVTINYRLGLLGFLNFKDSSLGIPGNAGLKDQVMALKWVQENISAFNGNPNNVTIFGQSAGGASCHYLQLSPLAKGLFHKAIMQSGSAIACWSKGRSQVPTLAKRLGVESPTEKQILSILRNMSSEEILKLQFQELEPFCPAILRLIGPVVENVCDEEAFLVEDPEVLIKSGRYNHVPVITGYCSKEGIISEIMDIFGHQTLVIKDCEKSIPYTLNLQGTDLSKQIAHKIKMFYYGDEEPSKENINQQYLIDSDSISIIGTHNSVRYHVKSTSQPIYLYRFSLESKLNLFKSMSGTKESGASHGDDLGYLFKSNFTPIIRPHSIEDEGIHKLTKLWTNFAHTGNPTSNQDRLINVKWKPVEKNELHFLDIGENLTVGVNPDYSRMKFWEEIYELGATNNVV